MSYVESPRGHLVVCTCRVQMLVHYLLGGGCCETVVCMHLIFLCRQRGEVWNAQDRSYRGYNRDVLEIAEMSWDQQR